MEEVVKSTDGMAASTGAAGCIFSGMAGVHPDLKLSLSRFILGLY